MNEDDGRLSWSAGSISPDASPILRGYQLTGHCGINWNKNKFTFVIYADFTRFPSFLTKRHQQNIREAMRPQMHPDKPEFTRSTDKAGVSTYQ